ncbi:YczE/YyaS/YitT family protein [Desulfotomaculum sp. 1211_IL3151]|uniref:YczE/YyaS/YitT family protein n=1 Tax=Desulfotomaculum sp. 1211_IL3151 TaxID=3084055 RepID=UPI002FDA6B93
MINNIVIKKAVLFLLQLFWFSLGLFICAFSVVLILESNLGLGPWDVFHISMTNYIPLTFGQVNIATGLLCVIIAYPMGIKPNFGTILNMLMGGIFIDFIMKANLIPPTITYLQQYSYLFVGIFCFGLGTGTYISANMGTGPRDSLMMGLHRSTGRSIGLVRTILEVLVVTLGFLLGGKIGLGTLIFSFTIGWFTQMFLALYYWIGRQSWFTKWLHLLTSEEVNVKVKKQNLTRVFFKKCRRMKR